MATLQAKKIAAALARAQGVGQVEDSVTIAGCRIVLQSLRPEEYEQIHADTSEKEDLEYLNAYRMEHLARSIVELNGEDLRSVDMVEVEGDDGSPLSVERHAFVRDSILATWSREAVDVAFRKFNDVTALAEKQAADGVKFDVPDETSEEKYRRLLAEIRSVEGGLPVDLTQKLLEESGYTKRVSPQDFDAAQERLRNMVTANESKEVAPAPREEPEPAPQPAAPQTIRATPAPPPLEIEGHREPMTSTRPASPEDLMRLRQPVHGQQQTETRSTSAPPPGLTRSQQIAMEEGIDPTGEPLPSIQGGAEIPEVQAHSRLDPKAAASILDRPPTGGVNKRFRPPPTM